MADDKPRACIYVCVCVFRWRGNGEQQAGKGRHTERATDVGVVQQ